jgi:hypothetical protein
MNKNKNKIRLNCLESCSTIAQTATTIISPINTVTAKTRSSVMMHVPDVMVVRTSVSGLQVSDERPVTPCITRAEKDRLPGQMVAQSRCGAVSHAIR